MSKAAQVPAAVADYFGLDAQTHHPIVREHFTPGQGWRKAPWNKRVSVSYLRDLRRQGVTHVSLGLFSAGRAADFSVAELLRSPRPKTAGL